MLFIIIKMDLIYSFLVEKKKQSLSSYTRLIIREWKIIILIYDKNNRQFDNLIQN